MQRPVSAIVRYYAGPYSGLIVVPSTPDDDEETILARARAKVRKTMTLPMYADGYKLVSRDDEED